MAALTAFGDHVGCFSSTRAATPAVYGDAIEVPPYWVPPSPSPDPAEMMASPGALMSGLRTLSLWRGPIDVNSADPR